VIISFGPPLQSYVSYPGFGGREGVAGERAAIAPGIRLSLANEVKGLVDFACRRNYGATLNQPVAGARWESGTIGPSP